MASLIYSPEVRILIQTSPKSRGKGQIVNVSEDIASGSLTRVTKGISTTDFVLLNQSRKYDGMFSPMDRVVVYLRRLNKRMLKFSGYLNYTPTYTAEPGSLSLRASCTMKRLANFYWDPGSPAATALLNEVVPNQNSLQDGGTAKRAIDIMTKVMGWPAGAIHIGRVPDKWFETVSGVADTLIAASEALSMTSAVGGGPVINGASPITQGISTLAGIGPGTGALPDQIGRCSSFGGPGGGAYGHFALTGENGSAPNDGWYCAMRWPYVAANLRSLPGVNVAEAKKWWANRRILVSCPKSGKAVVVRAADWGPNISTGRVIDLAPNALKALGAVTDDTLHIAFAPEGAALGPVSKAAAGVGTILSATGVGSPTTAGGWGLPGDTSNMVQATAGGIKFTCHRQAKANFEGFVNALITELGYHPKVILGYADRPIGTSSTPSNHAYGAAIDIDPPNPVNVYKPGTNPRYPTGAGGKYALPGPPAIITLARKWGLGWGGEYRNSKDYMHFEVLGAPQSNAAAYKGAVANTAAVVLTKWVPPIKNPPGYTITKRFADGGALWASGTHSGTDFACPSGTPIYPVGPGTVHNHGSGDPSYGNWVSVDHGNKIYTFYAHMVTPSDVPVGTPVTTKTVIGHVGQTGNATGPHVHVELRKGADTYTAATQSGGIEKYLLGANRLAPPDGVTLTEGNYASADASSTSVDDIANRLYSVWQWDHTYEATDAGSLLGGYRVLLNDSPISQTIGEFMAASMRDWCSAPNGDFIGWFPDYFGHYGQAGKMVISPLEIALSSGPPTVGWTDDGLVTHQFVTGASMWGANDADTFDRQVATAGIASIEIPELMQALLNISNAEAKAMATDMLSVFGARPSYEPLNFISGHRAEFFYAVHKFQEKWSQQYQTSIDLTFMPELYPGMLLCLPVYGIQGYVTQTVDSWDLRDGGGFHTTVSAAPWSTIGRSPNAIAPLPVGAAL